MKPIKYLLHAALFSLSLFCGQALHAQSQYPCGENLVPNPGFEDHTACPDRYSEIYLAPPWFQPTAGTSDYFNACAAPTSYGPPVAGVPINFAGSQPAHGGQAYAGEYMYGPGYREYIEVPLISPLVAGDTYNVSFYVSLASTSEYIVTNVGAYLSVNPVTASIEENLPVIPQVGNPAGNFLSSANWTLIQGAYTAAGGESYLTIGNFYDDAQTPTQLAPGGNNTEYAYYYIDDVSVMDTNACMKSCSNGCITISTPNDFTVFTCSNSLPVFFLVGATDNCCANFTLTTVPASGSTFPLGTTLVTSTVTDTCGNTDSCSFNLTVIQDTNLPFVTFCPTNIEICVNCNGCGFMPDATSEIQAVTGIGGTNVIVMQGIAPGTEICNDTTVTFTVADACGDATNCTVPVTLINCVNTNNCPQIQCWTNIVVNSCTNVPVYYSPTATDACCSNWTVTCYPASGSTFAPDTTNTITCVATDLCGNASSCCFTVAVICTNNCLQIQTPDNIVIDSCTNVLVTYPPLMVNDPCCGTNWSVVYDPPSGTSFAPDTQTFVNWYVFDCTSGTNFVATNSFLVAIVCTNCCQGPITNYTVTVVKGSNYLADCLCQQPSNTLADVIPSVPDGTEVYFWNPASGGFNPPDTFTGGSWHPGTETMFTGEGFLLVSFTNQYQLTICGMNPECGPGCSPLDCFSATTLYGDFGLNPNPADFCDRFCCPPPNGTGVQAWDPTTQSFMTYTYASSWPPPPLPVGYSEFVSVNQSICQGVPFVHIGQTVTNQISSLTITWSTNGIPFNNWQPQYSTDLVHWLTFPITGPATSPFIINETGSLYLAPFEFYRLVSTNVSGTN